MARPKKIFARRLSVIEAATKLGVHPQTLRKYIRAGQLRAFQTPSVSKFGVRHRILEADLESFIARHVRPSRIQAPPIDGVRNPVENSPKAAPISMKNSDAPATAKNSHLATKA